MRIVDALLAFPLIIIAVLVISILGPSITNVILVIGIVFTPIVARTVRSAVLVERQREYVAAAKLLGNSDLYIMFAEILPNIMGPIAVEITIRLGYAIFTSATLSFLALGIQQPSPDWGLTISIGRVFLQTAPSEVLFPAGGARDAHRRRQPHRRRPAPGARGMTGPGNDRDAQRNEPSRIPALSPSSI